MVTTTSTPPTIMARIMTVPKVSRSSNAWKSVPIMALPGRGSAYRPNYSVLYSQSECSDNGHAMSHLQVPFMQQDAGSQIAPPGVCDHLRIEDLSRQGFTGWGRRTIPPALGPALSLRCPRALPLRAPTHTQSQSQSELPGASAPSRFSVAGADWPRPQQAADSPPGRARKPLLPGEQPQFQLRYMGAVRGEPSTIMVSGGRQTPLNGNKRHKPLSNRVRIRLLRLCAPRRSCGGSMK